MCVVVCTAVCVVMFVAVHQRKRGPPVVVYVHDCMHRLAGLFFFEGALNLRKRALYLCKRALYLCKRALYLCKGALNLRQRALYLYLKEPFICANEPCISHQ